MEACDPPLPTSVGMQSTSAYMHLINKLSHNKDDK